MKNQMNMGQDSGGFILISPLPISAIDFMAALGAHGLRIADPGVRVKKTPDIRGDAIIAAGSGVTGYIMEDDGIEMDPDTLQEVFLEILPDGWTVEISGRYVATTYAMIETVNRFTREGDRIIVNMRRERVNADGTRKIVDFELPDTKDLSTIGQGVRGHLRAVS